MNSRYFALFAAFMVQLLYGMNYTYAKNLMSEEYIGALGLVFARVAGATILFWLFGLFLKTEKIDKKDYLKFFYAAIFGVSINMIFFIKGLEYTTPIHASVIVTVTPIVILILSSFFLNERITKLKIIGVILGFCGAVVLTIYGKSTRIGDNVPLGNLIILLNTIAYSIYIVMVKKLTAKYHPFTFIKWLFLFGLILVTPFCFGEFSSINWDTYTPSVFFSLGFVVVGATFGTYVLNPIALVKLKASTVGTFIYIQPVIAGIFAIIMGSDSLGVIKVAAALLIFAGVYLVSYNKSSKTV